MGKDCLLQIAIRLTSPAPLSYWAGHCVTLGRQSKIMIAPIQVSEIVVTIFFHLMAWGISCAFIYDFIVKQPSFIPRCSDCFLERLLTYSHLPKFPSFPFLSIVPSVQFSSVQSLNRVWLFVTPWIAARQASLPITISQSSLRLTSTVSVMPSSHLILGRPLLLLPPIPPSITVFSNESILRMGWPKY